jgi:hypothetical protein
VNDPKKFREVEPLRGVYQVCSIGPDLPDGSPTVIICDRQCTLQGARDIRDWLNKVLPEEKP